jgi:hypothetical protein
MDFEAVDQHVTSFAPLPQVNAANPAAQLCVYYKAAKPIIVLVAAFPFFPAKWKSVLAGFTAVLDLMCP